MPASTSVKYFHSAMSGAPVLSGTAGSLIDVLDACLVNGFNSKTVDTLTVASGVGTATIGLGVGAFEADVVVLISGATPSGLNGEKRIISTTANTITFDATGIANQTATGTITAKLAPAGWEKQFTGTNIAAYRSADVTSTFAFVRVDDTQAQTARVVGYESMSDIDTGSNPFPTPAQHLGLYWPKASDASATPRAWTIVADGKTFYLHMHTAATSQGVSGVFVCFGDFDPTKNADAYCAVLAGYEYESSTYAFGAPDDLSNATQTTMFIPRGVSEIVGAVRVTTQPESFYDGVNYYSGQRTLPAIGAYPNGTDGALVLTKKTITQPGVALMGAYRGLLICTQNCHSFFAWRDKVDFGDKRLIAIKCGSPAGTESEQALCFVDIFGQW